MYKDKKGITLVALVITIIVLLILAGVSISLVMGENGIMGKATNAADKTNEADARTALELAMNSVEADYFEARIDSTTAKRETYWTAENLTKYANGFEVTFDSSSQYPTSLPSGTSTTDISGEIKKKNASSGYKFVLKVTSSGAVSIGSFNNK